MENFPIAGLDFNQIKNNFVTFVKSDPESPFTDFDFEGSGINAFLNILAYNAHYLGYYIKMLLNESFIDTAVKRESLLSRAKLNAYIPAGYKTAKAKIKMTLIRDEGQQPLSGYITLPYGYNFLGDNYQEDFRKFFLLEPISTETVEEIYRYNDNNTLKSYRYTTPEFIIHEGEFRNSRYLVNSNNLSQQFIIQDKTIDLETLKVYVHPNVDASYREEFMLASDISELSAENKIYFITTTANGFYELFFGNNIFGQKLSHGNMISISYLKSRGADGNGCAVFSEPGRISTYGDQFLYFNQEDHFITTIESSHGGMSEESTDEMRFNIPNHFRRQNRMVTERDYKTLLLEKYRNIDSINVWGGEKHFFKDYGSIYLCIKPRDGLLLTETAKNEIQNYLKNYAVVGMQIKIIQPDYVWINVMFSIKCDSTITNLSKNQIKNSILNDTYTYNEIYLDRFNSGLSDVDLLTYIKQDKPYLTRIFNTKQLIKKFTYIPNTTTEHVIIFGNKLTPGSILSNNLMYGQLSCYIVDDSAGKIYIVDENGRSILSKSIGIIDYDTGIIKLIIDFNLNLTENIEEIIHIYAKPVNPDVDSYLNNIIKINQVEVEFS